MLKTKITPRNIIKMFKLSIGLCLLVAVVAGASVAALAMEWPEFKLAHGKSYGSLIEEKMRQAIFVRNKREIEQFNANGNGFELGLNHLADRTEEEMKQLRGLRVPEGLKQLNSPESEAFLARILADNSTPVPDELDWRKVAGRVSEVKNQGQCGSCWAFSAVGALEGQEESAAKRKDLVPLSEQNLVDCVEADQGCNGGLPQDAFDKVANEGGIDDEISYPYTGRAGQCKFNKTSAVMKNKGHAMLKSGDEEMLKQTVAKFGPVSVGIDASPLTFQFYRKGVYKSFFCSNSIKRLDHAVLVVGYGTDPKGIDYWIVKNSWSSSWGDEGYIKMARNKKNMCGIATMPSIPTF